MYSGKKRRIALWLNAMHSGKKWWIRYPFYIYILKFSLRHLLLARSAAIMIINLISNTNQSECRAGHALKATQNKHIFSLHTVIPQTANSIHRMQICWITWLAPGTSRMKARLVSPCVLFLQCFPREALLHCRSGLPYFAVPTSCCFSECHKKG